MKAQIARTVTYTADIEVDVGPDGQVDPTDQIGDTCRRLNLNPDDPPLKWNFIGMDHEEAIPAFVHP